jgi:hypothetical protein
MSVKELHYTDKIAEKHAKFLFGNYIFVKNYGSSISRTWNKSR